MTSLKNHCFISSNVGTTIPLFFLEVEESLTSECVSGMGSRGKSISVCHVIGLVEGYFRFCA